MFTVSQLYLAVLVTVTFLENYLSTHYLRYSQLTLLLEESRNIIVLPMLADLKRTQGLYDQNAKPCLIRIQILKWKPKGPSQQTIYLYSTNISRPSFLIVHRFLEEP